MLFQMKKPSISEIRAKLLLKKLRNSNTVNKTINLWKTGRTGSGKTTLANLLFGSDYFLPSGGQQDCTDEINLIQYANGLNTYDTPGVASKIYLENYNRAAFGIEQKHDSKSKPVQALTIAKYSQGERDKIIERNTFTVSNFRLNHPKPDLIYYLVAADKLFLGGDRNYLGDLLTYHQNVVYVLNIFTDKQTGNPYPTEQNIIDVVNNIVDIHQIFIGYGNPIIVPVNCWTGEGISDLIAQSSQLLGSKKGQIFSELIQYQQQNTPNQFLNEVKQEVLKLSAHVACEELEDNYSCNQAIHRASEQLIDFALHFHANYHNNSHFCQIQSLVEDTINSFEREGYSVNYFTDVNPNLFQQKSYEINAVISRLEAYEQDSIETCNLILESVEDSINSLNAENLILLAERTREIEIAESIAQKYQGVANILNKLVENFEPLAQAYRSNKQKIQNYIKEHNFRCEKYEKVRSNVNEAVNEYNRCWFHNQELYNFIQEGSNYLDQEKYAIEAESRSLDEAVSVMNTKAGELEEIQELIQTTQSEYYRLVNQLQAQKEKINEIEIQILKRKKIGEDRVRAGKNLKINFQLSLEKFELAINSFFNSELTELDNLRARLSSNDDSLIQFLEKINDFQEKLYQFNSQLSAVRFQLLVHRIIIELLQECTEYHFDKTDETEYRGKTYQKYGKNGVIFIVALSHLVLSEEITESSYSELMTNIAETVNSIDSLEPNFHSNEILKLLQPKANLLFNTSFEQKIRQLAY